MLRYCVQQGPRILQSVRQRTLPTPTDISELDENLMCLKNFFENHIVSLSPDDFAKVAMKLISEPSYEAVIQSCRFEKGEICKMHLTTKVFEVWKRKVGKEADFSWIKEALQEIGNKDMCDRMDFFISQLPQFRDVHVYR